MACPVSAGTSLRTMAPDLPWCTVFSACTVPGNCSCTSLRGPRWLKANCTLPTTILMHPTRYYESGPAIRKMLSSRAVILHVDHQLCLWSSTTMYGHMDAHAEHLFRRISTGCLFRRSGNRQTGVAWSRLWFPTSTSATDGSSSLGAIRLKWIFDDCCVLAQCASATRTGDEARCTRTHVEEERQFIRDLRTAILGRDPKGDVALWTSAARMAVKLPHVCASGNWL